MPPSAGLAHVATASFLASRLAPTGGFAVALAGGVAVARAAERSGLRVGVGTSAAAMLQTVAIMGPARVGIPLTQAVSAPLLGWMEARGRGTVAQAFAAGAVRLAHHILAVFLYVWLILGIDAYAGTYDQLLGRIPGVPNGRTAALVATAIYVVAWTIGASAVQAIVYRRGLARWPASVEAPPPLPPDTTARSFTPRLDPRFVVVVSVVGFGVLLASTSWIVLGIVSLLLAVLWLVARGDRAPIRPGLLFTAFVAVATLAFGLVGGLGLDTALRRTLRAALLVLVATWLRSAAGEEGLRDVFQRVLRRMRRVPGARETEELLDGLRSPRELAASGRRLVERLRREEDRKPVHVVDAVLDWVANEAGEPAPAALSAHPRVVP